MQKRKVGKSAASKITVQGNDTPKTSNSRSARRTRAKTNN
jgi:hypothetical protein